MVDATLWKLFRQKCWDFKSFKMKMKLIIIPITMAFWESDLLPFSSQPFLLMF